MTSFSLLRTMLHKWKITEYTFSLSDCKYLWLLSMTCWWTSSFNHSYYYILYWAAVCNIWLNYETKPTSAQAQDGGGSGWQGAGVEALPAPAGPRGAGRQAEAAPRMERVQEVELPQRGHTQGGRQPLDCQEDVSIQTQPNPNPTTFIGFIGQFS